MIGFWEKLIELVSEYTVADTAYVISIVSGLATVVAAIAAIIAVIVTVIIAKNQNTLLVEQNKISATQNAIANRQNSIAMFGEKNRVYNILRGTLNLWTSAFGEQTEDLSQEIAYNVFQKYIALRVSSTAELQLNLLQLGINMNDTPKCGPLVVESDLNSLERVKDLFVLNAQNKEFAEKFIQNEIGFITYADSYNKNSQLAASSEDVEVAKSFYIFVKNGAHLLLKEIGNQLSLIM